MLTSRIPSKKHHFIRLHLVVIQRKKIILLSHAFQFILCHIFYILYENYSINKCSVYYILYPVCVCVQEVQILQNCCLQMELISMRRMNLDSHHYIQPQNMVSPFSTFMLSLFLCVDYTKNFILLIGSKHMVDFLIDHGCNVNATDIFGDTALYLIGLKLYNIKLSIQFSIIN